MRNWPIFLFTALLCFCVGVECLDVYYSIKLQDSLYENELNPVGRYLIRLDGGNVAIFMAVKVATISIVMASLPLLYCFRKKLAWILLGIFSLKKALLLSILLL